MELTRYQLKCIDEDIVVLTDYVVDYPTRCPNNENHLIDKDSIEIYNRIGPKMVNINQNSSVVTGGYYRIDQYEMNIEEEKTIKDISYPYNVSIYSISILVAPENIGDSYEIISYPDTLVGQTVSPILQDEDVMTLNSVSTLNVGFKIVVNNQDLGYIKSVDYLNNKIYFSTNAPEFIDQGSEVKISVPRLTNGKIINGQNLVLGLSIIGSSGIEAGKLVRVIYTNKTGGSKTFNVLIELQY